MTSSDYWPPFGHVQLRVVVVCSGPGDGKTRDRMATGRFERKKMIVAVLAVVFSAVIAEAVGSRRQKA